MVQQFVIPRLFEQHKQLQSLPADDFSWIEYRQHEEQYKSRVVTTTFIFGVVLSGKKIIHAEEGDVVIQSGDAFFAKKGAHIMTEVVSSTSLYRTVLFFIGDQFLKNFLIEHLSLYHSARKRQNHSPAVFKINLSPLLQTSIQSALPYFLFSSNYSASLIRLKMQEVLLNIIDADNEGTFAGFLQDLYANRRQDLRQLMDDNYKKPVTIDELAALSGRSLSSFKRDFKSIFDDSPKRWINNRRLETARLLLANSDMNITEVCFEVGFENISYFSQLFKKKFGLSHSKSQNC